MAMETFLNLVPTFPLINLKVKLKMAIKKQKKVIIYTTSTCPWCMKTKEFMKDQKIKYEEVNVTENPKRRNEVFEKSGQMGVPVTDIEGTIIIGYDRTGIKKALGL